MPATAAQRFVGRLRYLQWRLLPCSRFQYTLGRVMRRTRLSIARCRRLYDSVRAAVAEGVPGDVVECGCARGGSAGVLALALKHAGAKDRRLLWLFDTFAGLPPPSERDPDYERAKRHTGDCLGTLDDVSGFMRGLGFATGVRYVKGLFQDTLPNADLGPIAVLHADGDWYDSTRAILEHLYDRVTPGGFIQLDDYGHWEGCRKAADEFFVRRGLHVELHPIDATGVWFRKPAEGRADPAP